MIGGLAVQAAAATRRPAADVSQYFQVSASPQVGAQVVEQQIEQCRAASTCEAPASICCRLAVHACKGAFVLLGTTPGGVDVIILLVMMVALEAYITGRFFEGLAAGQGSDSRHTHSQPTACQLRAAERPLMLLPASHASSLNTRRGFSPSKNFFKFRVSPIVSGAVYVSFILRQMHYEVRRRAVQQRCTACARS